MHFPQKERLSTKRFPEKKGGGDLQLPPPQTPPHHGVRSDLVPLKTEVNPSKRVVITHITEENTSKTGVICE